MAGDTCSQVASAPSEPSSEKCPFRLLTPPTESCKTNSIRVLKGHQKHPGPGTRLEATPTQPEETSGVSLGGGVSFSVQCQEQDFSNTKTETSITSNFLMIHNNFMVVRETTHMQKHTQVTTTQRCCI